MRRWMKWKTAACVAMIALAAPVCARADDAHAVMKMITAAYDAKKPSVTIPPGIYHVAADGHGAHLQFHDMHDFVINGPGVTLLMDDGTKIGIDFEHCAHVTLKGMTLEYAVSPSTQGTVVAISPDGLSYDIKIDKGYPTNVDDSRYFRDNPIGYLFNPKTRSWKQGAPDLYATGSPQKLSEDTFRFTWNHKPTSPEQPAAIGDLAAFRGSGRQMVAVNDSAEMHIDNVTILNAAGMAVRESGGDGGNHYSITVKRRPKQGEESTDPLLSSTADGFHSYAVRKGPTVENSYFEYMTDDGIAIHGVFSVVLRADGNQLTVSRSNFKPGDALHLYDPDGVPAGEAKVVSIAAAPGVQNTRKSQRRTREDQLHGPFTTLTLDHPLAADFDYEAVNSNAVGAGYIVRNNKILHNRARGMILKSDDGLVENNLIDGSTMTGILMTPEFWWGEAGYNHNIIVRGNTIRHEPVASRTWGAVVLTAMSDKADQKGGDHPVAGYGNQHILFENNTFEDNNGVNLLVTSAQDVKIIGNKFIRPNETAMEARGASWGEVPSATINIFASKDVTLHGNTVIAPGSANKSLVFVNQDAQAIGADTGIKLAK